MYEVYIMNRPVFFQENTPTDAHSLVIREPDKSTLDALPNLIRQHPDLNGVVLLSSNPEALWMNFCYGYREILAAGCVVRNQEGAYLWIERNGKWDLAKGKVESDEKIEDAAVREVEEETGIGQLTLVGDLGKTYHTYEENGVPVLKTTFWFLAEHAGGNTPGAPQTIEGITGVHWLPGPAPDHVRSGAYPSILALMDRATAAESKG
jgi:8-oxo-dGTP pyrophosphatase MutT (NUDIX family)